jgi:hypothetical protein
MRNYGITATSLKGYYYHISPHSYLNINYKTDMQKSNLLKINLTPLMYDHM